MSSYRKGIRLENQMVAYFEAKKGWFANRFTARGGMDVAAWTSNRGFVIECKNKTMTAKGAQILFDEMMVRFKHSILRPVLVYRNKHRKLKVLPACVHWAFDGIVDDSED